MAILSIQTTTTGLSGVVPSLIYIDTSSTQAQILEPGFLNGAQDQGYIFSNKQMALVTTSDTPTGLYNISVSNGVVSIVLVTLPISAGGTGVTATPKFAAYMSAAQSIPQNVDTKIVFNIVSYDTNSDYDSALYRFTPTIAGKYHIGAFVMWPTSSTVARTIFIYKNGAIFKRNTRVSESISTISSSIDSDLDMNGTTDYIEIFVLNGSSTQLLTAADSSYSTFYGHLLI